LEADELLPNQSFLEILLQDPSVLLFHYEDHVGPTDMALIHANSGPWLCAGRLHGITRDSLKHVFCG
jgi:hypothetical protein